jgi:fucose 4-O-acetylase-like acetyltransferase
MDKARLYYIDSVRGFAMLCVVLSHSLQACPIDCNNNLLYHFVESFQMPLFMFICGFVAFKPKMEFKTIKKRAVRLLLPWLIWCLVIGAIIKVISGQASIINSSWILHKFLYPSLWFLWALFFITLAFLIFSFMAQKLHIKHELAIAGGGVLLIGSFLFLRSGDLFAFDLISYHYTFYSIGFFVKKYWNKIEEYLKVIFYICLPMFILLFLHHKEVPPYEIFGYKFYSSMVIFASRWITGIVAIPVFLYLFKLIGDKAIVLQRIGQATIGVYIMHFFFLKLMPHMLLYCTMYVAVPVFLIATTAICYYITILIRKIPITRLLLLGEK